MAGADPKLVVLLEARLNKFEKQLADAGTIAKKQAKNIEDNFNKVNPSFAGIESGLKRMLAFASIGAITQAFKAAIDGISKVADVAGRAQVSTDFIQAIGFAAEQAGGSLEDAGKAAIKFGTALGQATDDSFITQLFELNGVQTKVNGVMRSEMELFDEYAKLVANAATPLEALNLVTQVFGEKVGPKMITTLQEIGRIGLPAFIKKMKEAGVVLDETIIKKGDEIGDKWNLLMTQMGNEFKTMVVGVVETGKGLAEFINDVWTAMKTGTTVSVEDNPAIQTLQRIDTLVKMIANAQGQIDAGLAVSPAALANLDKARAELEELNKELAIHKAVFGGPAAGAPKPPPGKPTVVPPPGGGDKSSKERVNDFEREVEALQKKMAMEEVELNTINLGAAARERAKVTLQLETAAKQANTEAGMANTEVTAEQRVKIDALADAAAKLAEKQELLNGPLAKYARDAANLNNQLQEAAVQGLKGFEDALIGIANGTKTVKDAFHDMANAIIQDLIRIAIRQAITGPIASMMFPGAGAAGGLFSLFGRAAGGPVNAKSPYVVGENGPELFVPQSAGRIVPNIASSKGGAGPGVVVSNTYHFDAGIGPADMALIRTQIIASEQRTKSDVVGIVRNALIKDSNALRR